jgi:Mn-dependent DtxR family transcriptional regulator
MVTKLADDSLVEHETDRGVVLTHRGETIARELAWRQCTIRTFFASQLDTALDTHAAYRLGYTFPKQAITRLTELVNHRNDTPCCRALPAESACLFDARPC